MFGIGMSELIVIFVIALVIFGPKKLPEIAKAIGKGIREFRRAMQAIEDTQTDASSKQEEKPR